VTCMSDWKFPLLPHFPLIIMYVSGGSEHDVYNTIKAASQSGKINGCRPTLHYALRKNNGRN